MDERVDALLHELNASPLSAPKRHELVAELRDELDYGDENESELLNAVHMLHEQAHDTGPIAMCRYAPCAHLTAELPHGPARLTSVAGL